MRPRPTAGRIGANHSRATLGGVSAGAATGSRSRPPRSAAVACDDDGDEPFVAVGPLLSPGSLPSPLAFAVAGPALAHGPSPPSRRPSLGLALGWSLEPAVLLPLLVVALGWIRIVRRVNAASPGQPGPAPSDAPRSSAGWP